MKRNSISDSMIFDPSELKVIRIFVVSFVLLLVYQVVILINTRNIDTKHRELLDARNTAGLAINNLLLQSSTTQRMLLNMAISNSPEDLQAYGNTILQAEKSTDESFLALESTLSNFSPEDAALAARMKEAATVYRESYRTYIDLVKSGQVENALEMKNTSVRPTLNAYQNYQQDLLGRISTEVSKESKSVSSYTSVSAWVLFFVGLLPFVYAIGKLIYVSVILRIKGFTHTGGN